MALPRLLLGVLWLAASIPGWGAPIKVACVGDSITEGSGLSDPSGESYPAKLGKLLAAAYEVRNFGKSGRTLLKNGDFPYWQESVYSESLSWEPDVVVIKLGTNDSKPQNWVHSAEYVGDYEQLIASYANLASHPRILLATPCPVYGAGAFSISPRVVADEVAPAVRGLASQLGLELIENHERMAGHAEWFPDTVHPNASGTTVMAALAYQVVFQTDPPPFLPRLTIKAGLSRRIPLEWSIEGAGYVLQTSPALEGPGALWSVTPYVAVSDGTVVRVDSIVRGTTYFRLWQP